MILKREQNKLDFPISEACQLMWTMKLYSFYILTPGYVY